MKVLERLLIHPDFNSLPFSPTQPVILARLSYTTALLPLVAQVAQGFNQTKQERTTTMVIDLSNALNMVNHTKLAFLPQLHQP